MATILELRNVRKCYGEGKHGLLIQDLEIQQGEFLVVTGPSGCGKTTLINLLAGFIKQDAGTVLKNDLPLPPPGADRMPVFQNHALFPWYTVTENIAYGLHKTNLLKKEIGLRVKAALEMVGLTYAANMYPVELSGGMCQRVALARALVLESEILLLDEPFASIDENNRRQLHRELLRLLHRYGPTIVMVTHNLMEAALLADRIAVLMAPPQGIKTVFKLDKPREKRGHHEVASIVEKLASILGVHSLRKR